MVPVKGLKFQKQVRLFGERSYHNEKMFKNKEENPTTKECFDFQVFLLFWQRWRKYLNQVDTAIIWFHLFIKNIGQFIISTNPISSDYQHSQEWWWEISNFRNELTTGWEWSVARARACARSSPSNLGRGRELFSWKPN